MQKTKHNKPKSTVSILCFCPLRPSCSWPLSYLVCSVSWASQQVVDCWGGGKTKGTAKAIIIYLEKLFGGLCLLLVFGGSDFDALALPINLKLIARVISLKEHSENQAKGSFFFENFHWITFLKSTDDGIGIGYQSPVTFWHYRMWEYNASCVHRLKTCTKDVYRVWRLMFAWS